MVRKRSWPAVSLRAARAVSAQPAGCGTQKEQGRGTGAPDLELDFLVVKLNGADLKVDACGARPVPRGKVPREKERPGGCGRGGRGGDAPMVEMNVELKASSEKRKRTQVLPTPLSPISSSLNR